MDPVLWARGGEPISGRPQRLRVLISDEELLAKQVCKECPVKGPCLDAGYGLPGIYGGLTELERRDRVESEKKRGQRRRIPWPLPEDIREAQREHVIHVRMRRKNGEASLPAEARQLSQRPRVRNITVETVSDGSVV